MAMVVTKGLSSFRGEKPTLSVEYTNNEYTIEIREDKHKKTVFLVVVPLRV